MATQKEKLKEFRSVCQTTDKNARTFLKQYDWNLDAAIDAYFRENVNIAQPIKPSVERDLSSLAQIFNNYEDPDDKDVCVAEYMENFLKDIGCKPEGVHSLALMWKLGATKMGILLRNEFIEGFSRLQCFTMEDMANAAGPDMDRRLNDETQFVQFYRWYSFDFSVNARSNNDHLRLFDYLKEDDKKRIIPTELALYVWNIVLDTNKFPLLDAYTKFIANNPSVVFNKDLWCQSYEFMRDTQQDLSNFDESGAWPSVVDDFVENLKKSH